jgi:hypothetical protein
MIADSTFQSVGLPGRKNPQLVFGERPIDCLLGCGHCPRFHCRVAHDHHSRNRRRPFPDVDALNNGIFDVPIFHHEPRFCGKRLARRMGSVALQNVAGTTAEDSDWAIGSSTSSRRPAWPSRRNADIASDQSPMVSVIGRGGYCYECRQKTLAWQGEERVFR